MAFTPAMLLFYFYLAPGKVIGAAHGEIKVSHSSFQLCGV
jgi:hypothetical protein